MGREGGEREKERQEVGRKERGGGKGRWERERKEGRKWKEGGK
jgi:hypothetical protein